LTLPAATRRWLDYPSDSGVWLVLDSNGDRMDDLAHVLAIARPKALAVRRHVSVAGYDVAQVDRAFDMMTFAVWRKDTAIDRGCTRRFLRSRSDVPMFTAGRADGIVLTQAQLEAVFRVPGRLKVANAVFRCAGRTRMTTLGCGRTGSAVVATSGVFVGTIDEGQLWAHEYGHTVGLDHRDTGDAIMDSILTTGITLAVNGSECEAFRE
jgi:hypothetical protein